jgi:fatty acid desaturase
MDNPFQPPMSDSLTEKTSTRPSITSTMLRVAILAFCSAQFLALLWNRGAIWEAMRAGEVSVLAGAASFLFALALMLAGVLLFFSRQSALWLLLAYLPYQLHWLVTAQERGTLLLCLLSLGCLTGCLVYCWRLKRAVRLTRS